MPRAMSSAPAATIPLTLPDHRQIRFSYPPSELMEKVLKSIFFEREYPLLPFIRPADVIVDVGANIGATAVMFCAQYPEAAAVYALEPAREAFEFLRANTATNFPSVKPFHCGAYDRDADVPLHLGIEASVTNSIIASIQTGATETVRLRRISSFLAEQGIERVSLMKIDTEGAELPILNDLRPMLEGGKIDALFVEYHSEADRLEFDRMLVPLAYTLCVARADHPHRGLMCYARQALIAERTKWEGIALRRDEGVTK